MILIIGGCFQGKLQYARASYCPEENFPVADGELPARAEGPVIVNHLHLWIRRRLEQGGCPEQEIEDFVRACPECIVICDEIGNGLVPVDAAEREYRERTGRILISLAAGAKEVVRVICGIGQRIK